jgi:hypothetical protein
VAVDAGTPATSMNGSEDAMVEAVDAVDLSPRTTDGLDNSMIFRNRSAGNFGFSGTNAAPVDTTASTAR